MIAERYRLGDVLGRSLMSEVRRGEDVRLRRPVAIKLLRVDGDPRSVARFDREAQILARLRHPNIVIIFDTGVDGGDRFIVMELIEGPTLRHVLDEEGGLELERATQIADGVVSALGSAHAHGIVHRDVKPSNVMLPLDGGVKLVDMGIARLLSAETLTMTLTALGTARYMSPEQAQGGALDGRSDIYSLGCVLFEMLTGRTPFDGDPVALSYAHSHAEPPRVRSIARAVPVAMDDLVAAMLEKDPADRPQTAEEVHRSLVAFATEPTVALTPRSNVVGLPPPPAPQSPTGEPPHSQRTGRSTAFIVLGGLVALVALVALLVGTGPNGRSKASGPSPTDRGTAQERSPVQTISPAQTVSQSTGQASPEQAAAIVLDTVAGGIAAGDISGHIGDEIRHSIDEILRETGQDGDVEKAVEKVEDLRDKVTEALDKGEITSASRASTIDAALADLANALGSSDD